METDQEILFHRWYVEPIRVLESIPYGDGGFVALATGCFLYERYATAVVKKAGHKANKEAKIKQLMIDFHLDQTTAEVFWTIVRDGMLHEGMPLKKKGLPRCKLSNFPLPIALEQTTSGAELQIQPWLFARKVTALWQDNLDLLKASHSFPWASII